MHRCQKKDAQSPPKVFNCPHPFRFQQFVFLYPQISSSSIPDLNENNHPNISVYYLPKVTNLKESFIKKIYIDLIEFAIILMLLLVLWLTIWTVGTLNRAVDQPIVF